MAYPPLTSTEIIREVDAPTSAHASWVGNLTSLPGQGGFTGERTVVSWDWDKGSTTWGFGGRTDNDLVANSAFDITPPRPDGLEAGQFVARAAFDLAAAGSTKSTGIFSPAPDPGAADAQPSYGEDLRYAFTLPSVVGSSPVLDCYIEITYVGALPTVWITDPSFVFRGWLYKPDASWSALELADNSTPGVLLLKVTHVSNPSGDRADNAFSPTGHFGADVGSKLLGTAVQQGAIALTNPPSGALSITKVRAWRQIAPTVSFPLNLHAGPNQASYSL